MNANHNPVKIFITGATGYIGGTILTKLLQASNRGKYDITALTRSEATIPKFKELGVKTVLGDLDSAEILTQAAIDADVVLHFAHADHLPAAKALVKGLKTQDGKRRIYIHNSGTSVLADQALGNNSSEKTYSDLDVDAIHSLPITQPHKDVESYIFENCQGFDLIVVCPPTIYGLGSGPFNQNSVQVPALVRGFLKAGKIVTVNKSANIWSCVHVDDLANFYILLLEKALKGEASTGRDGWYFCESGEYVWRDVIAKIGEELYKNKVINDPKPVETSFEECNEIFGEYLWYGIASNSRSRADRARQLGWKPSKKSPKILDTIEDEVKAMLAKEK